MFDSIAASYDKLNHIMSLDVDKIWRRHALKYIVDGTPQNILDVACGTGDSTIAAAKAAARLVLSPQSEIPAFRSFLQKNGFRIADEAIVFEDGKFYVLMTAEPGKQTPWRKADRLYGKHLLKAGGETLKAFLARRIEVLEEILRNLEGQESPGAERKRRETEEELALAREALNGISQ